MTLVIPRLIGAVAGFLSKHGSWPTRIVVPVENWRAYRDKGIGDHPPREAATALAVLRRVDLVPVPRQVYIAIDGDGRSFDYDSEDGAAEDYWRTVERNL